MSMNTVDHFQSMAIAMSKDDHILREQVREASEDAIKAVHAIAYRLHESDPKSFEELHGVMRRLNISISTATQSGARCVSCGNHTHRGSTQDDDTWLCWGCDPNR